MLEALADGRAALDVVLLRLTHLACLSIEPVLFCRVFLCGDPIKLFWQVLIQLPHERYLTKVSKKPQNRFMSLDTDSLCLGHESCQDNSRNTARAGLRLEEWGTNLHLSLVGQQVILQVHA